MLLLSRRAAVTAAEEVHRTPTVQRSSCSTADAPVSCIAACGADGGRSARIVPLMTLHPVAVVATIVVLGIASLATWLVQRALRRRRGRAENDLAQWQWLFALSCAVFGGAAWLVLNATGLLHH